MSSIIFLVAAATCNYNTFDWDVKLRKSVNHRQVVKADSDLSSIERDGVSGCRVCREDQRPIRVKGVGEVLVCKAVWEPLSLALQRIQESGYKIMSLSGYRVGKTRGKIQGSLRTEFSNHSFGTAIDVNAESNGLYTNCVFFGPECQLTRGGVWHPNHPQSITLKSVVYRAMTDAGLKWGGEIKGRQKDFMHFSLTGY